MMTVRLGVISRKASDHDVGLKRPHDPNHVGENFFPVPDVKRFLGRFGKAKIIRAREKLFAAIDAAGSEQFLGADDPELVA